MNILKKKQPRINHKQLFKELETHLIQSKRLYHLGIEILENPYVISKIMEELSKGILKTMEFYFFSIRTVYWNKEKRFFKKIVSNYIKEEQRKDLIDIIILNKKYKKSLTKFSRNSNLVIFSGGRYIVITPEKIRQSINSLDELLQNIKSIDINTR